jgi:RNA-directed DNA polymerase
MYAPPATNGPSRPTDWNAINWRQAQRQVRNLRQRIFRASQAGDWKTVRSLQKLMLRSRANTLVSVRRVTQVNQGKYTAGVDKLVVKTPAARGQLVDQLLASQPWRAKPARRVYIPKASGKLRPLGIPTVVDRCQQARVKNALEPEWEARFEATSSGFRPGRSCQDALAKIYLLACPHRRKKWVVDADIQGAFDNISHNHLLEAIGLCPGRALIKQWLKAGYMEDGVFHETTAGTPQGSVISPLLANIALHGLEAALGVKHNSKGEITGPRAVVRYADDLVAFCESREDAEAAQADLTRWLQERGLILSAEKTRIVHLSEGFDFLGFNIRQYKAPQTSRTGYKLLIKPSKRSVQRIRQRLREEWQQLRGHNVRAAVKRLNPIIRGWANYFRSAVASETFNRLDRWMNYKERRYVKRRHPAKPWAWRKRHYWGKLNPEYADQWVFGDTKMGYYLLKFSWFKIERHVLVRGTASPDDPTLQEYWAQRAAARTKYLPRRQQELARQQDYACPLCGESLFNEEERQVHHIEPKHKGGQDDATNHKLVHLYCHQQIHSGRITPMDKAGQLLLL